MASELMASHLLTGPRGGPLELRPGQPNFVDHGVGKRVRWMLVSPSVDCRVWESEADEVLPTKVLALRTSAPVKCFLLVFPA